LPENQTDIERLLSRYISYKEKLEQEKETLVAKLRMLQDLCEKKDYFIQSKNMLLRLRESRITELLQSQHQNEQNNAEDTFLVQSLREEIEQLKYQLAHHPELLRFAIENFELRETLAEYETQFGEMMEERHKQITDLKEWINELSKVIKKVLDEKYNLLQAYTAATASVSLTSASNATTTTATFTSTSTSTSSPSTSFSLFNSLCKIEFSLFHMLCN
jgi:hypothetical protein